MRSRSLYATTWGSALVLSLACTATAGENMFDPSTSGEPTSTGTSTTTTTSSSSGTTAEESSSSSTTAESETEQPETSSSSSSSSGDAESSSSSGFIGSICGDGMVTGFEQCDCGGERCTKESLNNTICEDVRDPLVPGLITGGVLSCNPNSCQFDTTQCVYCGDGEVNGTETCEANIPIETSCSALGKGTAGVLTCMEDLCQVETANCTDCGYTFTFDEKEGCPGEWTQGRTTQDAPADTWECGDPGNHAAGPGVGETGVWGTQLDGNYRDNESAWVQSPPMDLTNCDGETVAMTIRHWWNFEGFIVNADGGIVQASFDGINWQTITPVEGALYVDNPLSATYPPVDNTPGFSGNAKEEQMWVESTFDITSYAGATGLFIRFVIGSDAGNSAGGWYIDSVTVLGSPGKKK